MSFLGGKSKSKETSQSNAPSMSTRRASGQSPIESSIGPNTYINGDIQGDGGLRVDGIVEGNIELTGNLVVTESAKIRAQVKAKNISVAGAIQGDITATRVEILDTGRVWGDLTVKALLINEGAYFRGQTLMPQDLQPPQLEAPKSEEETTSSRTSSSRSEKSSAASTSKVTKPDTGNVVDVEPK
jgi:cytoskeletal protein CcmA (bactofilin family)